jgi:hypothetical protein
MIPLSTPLFSHWSIPSIRRLVDSVFVTQSITGSGAMFARQCLGPIIFFPIYTSEKRLKQYLIFREKADTLESALEDTVGKYSLKMPD